ncbi:hypothetical protein INT44_005031 [Umbelopsis vinacea]|uniref:OTU domain-containing protein n=1 Tax=Umbelopsis vinacea TaxID=44442 RepID=A0A8H7Q874_9FUNG|nr:hypothetical protein INT44_005031 [Umbelopsis vinacea]
MSNDDELREAVANALGNPEEDTIGASTEVEAVPLGETLDEMLTRHRKEIRQLNAETTALKKTATKGEKKKKKEVLTQIAVMESEMNKRHEEELRQHQRVAGDPANVEPEQEDELDDGISLDRLNELTIEEGLAAPTATPNPSDSQGRKKPNRQKQRKERKEAQIQKMREEADKEAEGQVDRGQLESEAINELLVPMRLRVSEVCSLWFLLTLSLIDTFLPIRGFIFSLYNAVSDQLAARYKVKANYKELRKEAADYIRGHPDDFIPFLYKDDGGMYTNDDLNQYCDELENTAVWGGQLEILALSKTRKVPFHIIQMGSPVLKISDDEFPSNPPIKLAYHKHLYSLGEHYNSLLDV